MKKNFENALSFITNYPGTDYSNRQKNALVVLILAFTILAVTRLITRGPASDGYDIYAAQLVQRLKTIGKNVPNDPTPVEKFHPTRILYSLISAFFSLITSLNTTITGFLVSFVCFLAFIYYLSQLSKEVGFKTDDSFVILVAAISTPALTKAIASITPDLMGALFCLTCLYYYFRYDKEKKIRHLIFIYISIIAAFFSREALILLIVPLALYPAETLSKVRRFMLFILPGLLLVLGGLIFLSYDDIVAYTYQFLPWKVIDDIFLHHDYSAALKFLLWDKWRDFFAANFLYLAFFESFGYSIGVPLIFAAFKILGNSTQFYLRKRTLFWIWGVIYLFSYFFIYLGRPVGRIWLPILVSVLIYVPDGIETLGSRLGVSQERARRVSIYIFVTFGIVVSISRILAGILDIAFNWCLYCSPTEFVS